MMTNRQGAGKTVLVIDDDTDFLAQQELALRACGYGVVTADSTGAARVALAGRRPDAMVVDLMLDEDDDGFVLCHEAKRMYPGMPVILVTGVAHETGIEFEVTTSEERSWIKADRLLSKPIRAEQILTVLDQLMRGVSPG